MVTAIITAISAGCGTTSGSGSSEPANSQDAPAANAAPTGPSTSANPDGSVPELANAPAGEANTGSDAPMTISELANRKRERLGDAAARNEDLPPVKPVKRPAPDNSEYWSTLTDVAREYREFKNNPQIKQVVRVNDGTNSVLQIHLKNDKVVEKPGNQVRNLANESVNTFIRLAGLTPPALPQPAQGDAIDNPDKKREKSTRP